MVTPLPTTYFLLNLKLVARAPTIYNLNLWIFFLFRAFVVFESLANLPSVEGIDVEFRFPLFLSHHLDNISAETTVMIKQRYLAALHCTFARDLSFQSPVGRLPARGFET